MGAPPVPKNYSVYSIQTVYTLYEDTDREYREGVPTIHCKNVIKIPIAEPVVQKIGIDTYTVTPCTAYVFANDVVFPLKIFIETNEGVTVEPILVKAPLVPYNTAYLLTLPRGTTGIKKAYTRARDGERIIQNDLVFDIAEAPYNYENALFGVITSAVSALDGRVDALESKTDNLKLVTKTPTFAHVELLKGTGKQTINIEDGVLFYNTSFSYPLSIEPTIHNPKITLHGAGRDQVYTLSLNKTTNTVSIDLFTGMITVYAGVAGEIMQQFKLALPYNGFETLSFEDFDDIDSSVLRVTLKGARVQ